MALINISDHLKTTANALPWTQKTQQKTAEAQAQIAIAEAEALKAQAAVSEAQRKNQQESTKKYLIIGAVALVAILILFKR